MYQTTEKITKTMLKNYRTMFQSLKKVRDSKVELCQFRQDFVSRVRHEFDFRKTLKVCREVFIANSTKPSHICDVFFESFFLFFHTFHVKFVDNIFYIRIL